MKYIDVYKLKKQAYFAEPYESINGYNYQKNQDPFGDQQFPISLGKPDDQSPLMRLVSKFPKGIDPAYFGPFIPGKTNIDFLYNGNPNSPDWNQQNQQTKHLNRYLMYRQMQRQIQPSLRKHQQESQKRAREVQIKRYESQKPDITIPDQYKNDAVFMAGLPKFQRRKTMQEVDPVMGYFLRHPGTRHSLEQTQPKAVRDFDIKYGKMLNSTGPQAYKKRVAEYIRTYGTPLGSTIYMPNTYDPRVAHDQTYYTMSPVIDQKTKKPVVDPKTKKQKYAPQPLFTGLSAAQVNQLRSYQDQASADVAHQNRVHDTFRRNIRSNRNLGRGLGYRGFKTGPVSRA